MAVITTVATFDRNHPDPGSGLVIDNQGDIFGTTRFSAYELMLTATGYSAPLFLASSFDGTLPDGSVTGDLTADGQGNLFGTTSGGSSAYGTVYELPRVGATYGSAITLASGDDISPDPAGLIMDAAGNLFGVSTQFSFFAHVDTTIFEIPKGQSGYGALTALASFSFSDQTVPALVQDAAGNLFGATASGGLFSTGSVFELPKTGSTCGTVTTLATFNGQNGLSPGVYAADSSGDLFGATASGGNGGDGSGTVFEINKTSEGYSDTPLTLATFTGGSDGSSPGSLIIDAAGDLFGLTPNGGSSGHGTLFEIARSGTGYGPLTTLASFGEDLASPAGLIADAAGNLFGTSSLGGDAQNGAVFEVTGSGYVVACYCPGTLIAVPGRDIPVEDLGAGDPVLTLSGAIRPIKWIGRRSYAALFAARNPALRPIRVRAGALGEGVPRRDLLVSPRHALFLDGVLVPAEALVNGVSVSVAEPGERIDYVHIELDSHDILLAEGTPAESFVNDWGCRGQFDNADEYARRYPGEEPDRAVLCAPRHEDGPVVEAIWRWVADRAGLPRAGASAYGALQGFVERIEDGLLHGWARNERYPDAPVDLDVLVDGTLVTRVLAERYRTDLAVAGLGRGYHCFRLAVPGAATAADLARVIVRRAADRTVLPSLVGIAQKAA